MSVLKCSNGLFRIGTGPCVYKSKEKAERAYAAYRAQRNEVQEMATELTKNELIAMLDARIRRDAGWRIRRDDVEAEIAELGISDSADGLKKMAQLGYDDIVASFEYNDNIVKATRAITFNIAYVKKIIKTGLADGTIRLEALIMKAAEKICTELMTEGLVIKK